MVRLFFALWDNFQSGTALLDALQQNGGGSVGGGVGEKFHALGFQIMGSKGTHQIGQPLGAVAEGKATAITHQSGGTGAYII